MARGRHRRRSGLLARLRPGRGSGAWFGPSRRRVRWTQQEQALLTLRSDLYRLEGETARLRVLGAQQAAAAASADLRARRAEESLGAATSELAGLRGDLAALREELVWAFAERRLDATSTDTATGSHGSEAPAPGSAAVIDLRTGTPRVAGATA